MSDAKTYVNNVSNDFVHVAGGSSGGDAAWDPALCRFFFVDGDNGDDSHAGYLDAPPGTVFSPVDAAAVAIRTTKRLDEIRPTRGNGRMVATLWKPRTLRAIYDYSLPGDGRGRDNRQFLSGYRLCHSRASDHTNSAEDKRRLGYVTAVGPFTVEAVNNVLRGVEFVLGDGFNTTDPIHEICQYRVRVHLAADGTDVLLNPRWGETTRALRTNVLTTWDNGGAVIQPGDQLFLEIPGAVVDGVTECPYAEDGQPVNPNPAPSNLVAGLAVVSQAFLGRDGNPTASKVVGVRLESLCAPKLVGSFFASNTYEDEAGTPVDAAVGIVSICGFFFVDEQALPRNITMQASKLVETTNSLQCMSFTSTGGNTLRMLEIVGAPARCQVFDSDYGRIVLRNQAKADVVRCCQLPTGQPGIFLDAYTFSNPRGANAQSVNVQQNEWLVDASSSNNPGIVVSGCPKLSVDFGDGTDALPGTGVRVRFNELALPDTIQIDVPWDSLRLTGFKVVGGAEIECRLSGTGYQDNVLPCPRCKVGKFADDEGTTATYGLGSLVAVSGDNTVDLPDFSALVETVVGFLAAPAARTNGVGGPALVVTEDSGILLLDDVEARPAEGAPLFASQSILGAVTRNPPIRVLDENRVGPVFVGKALPMGYVPGVYIFASFFPGARPIQLAPVLAAFETSVIALADVPNVLALVRAGHTYEVEALLTCDVVVGEGSHVALTFDGATSFVSLYYLYTDAVIPAVATAKILAAFGDGGGVLSVENGAGTWIVKGSFRATTDGVVRLQAALKALSEGVTTPLTVHPGSYLKLTEQV